MCNNFNFSHCFPSCVSCGGDGMSKRYIMSSNVLMTLTDVCPLLCAHNPNINDAKDETKIEDKFGFGYFCLFIIATGCPSEQRPKKTVSCYGG